MVMAIVKYYVIRDEVSSVGYRLVGSCLGSKRLSDSFIRIVIQEKEGKVILISLGF